MKRNIRIIVAVMCVLVVGASLVGCSCSSTDNKTNSTTAQSANGKNGTANSKDANNTNASANNGANANANNGANANANNGANTNANNGSGNSAAPAASESKGTGIVGSFKFDDPGASLVFTFNSDKTGVYNIMGQKMNFTYNDDGSNLNIKFDGDSNVTDTPYTLNGDTLTIKDASGSDMVYHRV